jgi:regulator of cell morphogenesis and NO signaling
MISHLLTPKTITQYDRNIVHLFSRFNIGSDSTLKLNEICEKDEININLLVDLINCYNDLSCLEKTNFEDYSIIDLIDYLEKSHLYYLEKKIPEIEQSLLKLGEQESYSFNYIFIKFFKEYKKDIVSHFKTEDEVLFPFCKVLDRYIKFNSQEDLIYILENKETVYHLMDQHKKNNDEVDDLQKLLIKYSPKSNKLSYFEIFLNQMSLFQKDLKIHAEIEENILMEKIKFHLSNFEIKDV